MISVFKIGFLEVSWVDFVDIALVSILLYQVYKLIRGSIAVNIFLGILALYLVYLIVRAAQMELLSTILNSFENLFRYLLASPYFSVTIHSCILFRQLKMK